MLEANRRISKGRSRNGCITCKTPSPRPGVGAKDLRIVQHVPHIQRPIRMWQVSQSTDLVQEAEYRSLEFFQVHTTQCFGANIGSFLLRAAHQEPIIGTIAIAIGSLHRSFMSDQHGSSSPWDNTRFTLFQYNKAIKQLVNIQPHTSPQTNDTFLIACVLFFCFECLQEHYRSAFQHAISGLKIIKQQQMLSNPSSLMYMPPKTIALLFTILDSQMLEIQGERSLAMELRPSMSSSQHLNYGIPQQACSVDELITSFQLVYNRFTRFETFCESLEELSKSTSSDDLADAFYLKEEHTQISESLNSWMAVFDDWLRRQSPFEPPDQEKDTKIMILKIWRTLVDLLVQIDWPFTELAWDAHTAHFETIVALAEKMLDIPSTFFPPSSSVSIDTCQSQRTVSLPSAGNNHSPSLPPLRPKPIKPVSSVFSLSLGIVTPLYLAVTRCRDSGIRYRALNLLIFCQRREGVWDSELAGRIAKHTIAIEESSAKIEPGTVYVPADIGMAARVQTLNPEFENDRGMKVSYNQEVQGEASLAEDLFSW
ncbi:hypothetical protein N7456_003529 [Penicillium angulare]|uniref:Transcription factor n=1 Tax=Penicillium angulare TaxID=116970 RepID=A0A9W9FUW5_9EURO|nr:hypothetical protein N7456_003529 [Penicillium angulare]